MFLQLVFCVVIGVYGIKGQLFGKCPNKTLTEINTCISNSPDFSDMTLTTVATFFANPTNASCSKKTEFNSLIKCVHDLGLKCFDDSFKTIFPTHEMNEKTVNYLCSKINSYDVNCLLKSIIEIAPCVLKGLELSSSPTYEEMKAFQCGSQKQGKKCTEDSTEFKQCPETKETFLELNKIQNPEACGGEAGFESGDFDDGKSTDTPMDQSENTAPTFYQSVFLLTTITLMKIIF